MYFTTLINPYSSDVDLDVLVRNVKIISEGVAKDIYNLSREVRTDGVGCIMGGAPSFHLLNTFDVVNGMYGML